MPSGFLFRPALVLLCLSAHLPSAARAADTDLSEMADLVLRAPAGDTPLDREIIALQKELRSVPAGSPRLERLGWLFLAKARAQYDDGWYRQAEQCAALLDASHPGSPAALLLKGQALESMHRFSQAETAARALVARRGLAYDYGLLGDALMEQGRLEEARVAYQAMMDRKPGSEAYARAAHLRWLYGDAQGACDMMALAVSAASPRDAQSLAWSYAQSGLYLFQLGRIGEALAACDRALALVPDHAAALALRGRIRLSRGQARSAATDLASAARLHPLPEIQWALADALRACGSGAAADSVENALADGGARKDPRSLALFLATRRRDTHTAHDLAVRERAVRGDIFTHDALAWTAFAEGDLRTASREADSALAPGTRDARLFLHAGLIARAAGDGKAARAHLSQARALAHTLLPSERKWLENSPAIRRE